MFQVKEYITAQGRNPFRRWFRKLTTDQTARVLSELRRLSEGRTRDSRHLGGGVYELRLHMGPGFRIYYGRE